MGYPQSSWASWRNLETTCIWNGGGDTAHVFHFRNVYSDCDCDLNMTDCCPYLHAAESLDQFMVAHLVKEFVIGYT